MALACCIETEDAVTLPGHLFLPDGEPRAAVLIAGAYAVPQGYYARFAKWLSDQGYAVLTFDYRGIGEARPRDLSGFRATASDWGRRDLTAAVAHLRWRFPGRDRFFVGHSFGGQALGLMDGGEHLSGALVLASGFVTQQQWTGPQGWKLLCMVGVVMPVTAWWYGYLPAWTGIGEDVPTGAAMEWRRWLLSPRYLLDHVPGAGERYARIGGPVRIVRFTDDDTAGAAAVTLMREGLVQAEEEVVSPADWGVEAIGHMGFFRPRCAAGWDSVVATLASWSTERYSRAS